MTTFILGEENSPKVENYNKGSLFRDQYNNTLNQIAAYINETQKYEDDNRNKDSFESM
jgi:hypothetical protein